MNIFTTLLIPFANCSAALRRAIIANPDDNNLSISVYTWNYGYLIDVPNDPAWIAKSNPIVRQLLEYARLKNARQILLDNEMELDPELPMFGSPDAFPSTKLIKARIYVEGYAETTMRVPLHTTMEDAKEIIQNNLMDLKPQTTIQILDEEPTIDDDDLDNPNAWCFLPDIASTADEKQQSSFLENLCDICFEQLPDLTKNDEIILKRKIKQYLQKDVMPGPDCHQIAYDISMIALTIYREYYPIDCETTFAETTKKLQARIEQLVYYYAGRTTT